MSSHIVDEYYKLLELESKESYINFLKGCDKTQGTKYISTQKMKFLSGEVDVVYVDKGAIKESYDKLFVYLKSCLLDAIDNKLKRHNHYNRFNTLYSLVSYKEKQAIKLVDLQDTISTCRKHLDNGKAHMMFLKRLYQDLTDLGLI